MKRCLLIINPYSGKMKINNELVDVIKILNENKDKEGTIYLNGDLNGNFKPRFREKV